MRQRVLTQLASKCGSGSNVILCGVQPAELCDGCGVNVPCHASNCDAAALQPAGPPPAEQSTWVLMNHRFSAIFIRTENKTEKKIQ
jgi:hypothetical protein